MWKEPEVEEQYGPDRTILTLSFIKKVVAKIDDSDRNMDGEHVSTHETIHETTHDARYEAQVQKLLDFCSEPRSRSEMQEYLGLTNRSYFSKGYIMPLVNSGKLKMTIPDKPRSRNQKYIKA
ncbi:MAG: hypothetical protein LUD12_10830 [Lachnospiraceae bacterium]|nr:hypothetical protein [Lachnospiraceae bacterium]